MSTVIDITAIPTGVTEPVSVADAKAYAKVNGSTEDTLIGTLITAARQAVEKYTGLSLVEKDITAILQDTEALYELPQGPVNAATLEFTDIDLDEITIETVGLDFTKVRFYQSGMYMATYTTAWEAANIPAELKVAILDQFTFLYQNRGDNQDTATICPKAQKSAMKYSRIPFFF